jgi:uncharacterized protein
MDKTTAHNIISSELPNLSEQYPIKNMGIFGSVARGEHTENSDIDILVEFNAPIGFFDFIKLENHLSKLLGRKVDLISKNALKPAVRDIILNEVAYV